jgi:hypothetical protein
VENLMLRYLWCCRDGRIAADGHKHGALAQAEKKHGILCPVSGWDLKNLIHAGNANNGASRNANRRAWTHAAAVNVW